MGEAVVADEVGGLGALAAAGAAEEEDHGDGGGGETGLLLGHFAAEGLEGLGLDLCCCCCCGGGGGGCGRGVYGLVVVPARDLINWT